MQKELLKKLDTLKSYYEDLLNQSVNPNHDHEQYNQLKKEITKLAPLFVLYNKYLVFSNDLITASEMLLNNDTKEFAEEEIGILKPAIEKLEHEIQLALLPKDENDVRDIFLEIRAGTGGDEAALFVQDLFRMYTRYAERNNWKVEIISISESNVGGYKEIIAKIIGNNVYEKLKFESGAHRVQRIPITETQGRIHTSACTVAVMPETDSIDEVVINPAEIRIDTYRASGAGGQHVNKTDSAIRITHLPTGIVVECQSDRSQHRNKAKAMSLLATKIQDFKLQEQNNQIASTRKSLIGSGDRSERIRTYNFPQGRITDHRINLTLYKLESVLDGDIFELINSLINFYQTEQLLQINQ